MAEIIKIKDVRYMDDRIIFNYIFKKEVYYKNIKKYYITYGDYFGRRGKYITIETFDKKKYKICIGILSGIFFIGDFEELHISLIKKKAPQAEYIKKEKLSNKIKRKLRN
ncbi:MAG: hypothetical protein HFI73_02275 [Bacilli bacterium]|jgi:hypothetical protein|nr:hypothetical protein [Bacilli bacterium]